MHFAHINGITAKAEFATEGGMRYRYRLDVTRVGASASPRTACVVMQNPSYAGDQDADKSVQFMEKVVFERGLSEFAGIERLIVVNQFARVQTTGFVGLPAEIGTRNDRAIERALDESEVVIIGWGVSNAFESRKEYVLGLLRRMQGKRLYKTSQHPSRGRYAGFIKPLEL